MLLEKCYGITCPNHAPDDDHGTDPGPTHQGLSHPLFGDGLDVGTGRARPVKSQNGFPDPKCPGGDFGELDAAGDNVTPMFAIEYVQPRAPLDLFQILCLDQGQLAFVQPGVVAHAFAVSIAAQAPVGHGFRFLDLFHGFATPMRDVHLMDCSHSLIHSRSVPWEPTSVVVS